MEEYPKSYTIGQEYCDDREIPVIIRCKFSCPVYIEDVFSNDNLEIFFDGPDLVAEYLVLVNQEFVEKGATSFIVAWVIKDILPQVNKFISNWKYTFGNFLIMSLSFYDVKGIFILDAKRNLLKVIPQHLEQPFPHDCQKLTLALEKTYMRDFLNTISEKLRNNYEDCIRRGISTLETLFMNLGFKGTFNENRTKLITDINYPFSQPNLQILNWNIWGLYKMRNAIVHDKLRSNYDDNWQLMCHRLIGTLNYIIQCCGLIVDEEKESISKIVMHYLFQHQLGLHHMDRICEWLQSTDVDCPVIETGEQMDDFMFKGLKIPEEEFQKCGINLKYSDLFSKI